MVALGLLLAILSWRFVETPFRKRRYCPTRNSVFAFGALTVSVVISSGALLRFNSGFPHRLPDEALRYADAKMDCAPVHQLTTKDVVAGNLIPFGSPNRGAPVQWLVWGDSHAMAAIPAFDTFLKEQGIAGVAATHSGTAPVLDYFRITKAGLGIMAPEFNDAVLDYIKARRIPNVVLVAFWSSYDDENLSLPGNHPFDESLLATMQKIVRAGSQPWVLLDVPIPWFDVPRVLARCAIHQQDVGQICPRPDSSMNPLGKNSRIVTKLQEAGARILDPRPEFLSKDRSHYVIAMQGFALYSDWHHLSTRGANAILVPFFRASIPTIATGHLIGR